MATSSQTSLPPVVAAPRPARRPGRTALVGAALALTAMFVGAGTWALRREEPLAPLSSWPLLEDRLRTWDAVIRSPQITPASLRAAYADAVRFRTSGPVGHQWISDYWLAMFGRNGGTVEVDFGRSSWRREALAPGMTEQSECARLAGATGDVVLVRLAMTEVDPTRPRRAPAAPCPRWSGAYLVRLREVAGRGLLVCHETWSIRDGLCAPGSCPQARQCRGLAR